VEGAWVIGLVTLADLQRTLSNRGSAATVRDCFSGDLIWLPETAHLAQLEDQLEPNGLRQLPVFGRNGVGSAALPQGLPAGGLAIGELRGLASRDGLARALARLKLRQKPTRVTGPGKLQRH
jgi:CBS domain-containing protein